MRRVSIDAKLARVDSVNVNNNWHYSIPTSVEDYNDAGANGFPQGGRSSLASRASFARARMGAKNTGRARTGAVSPADLQAHEMSANPNGLRPGYRTSLGETKVASGAQAVADLGNAGLGPSADDTTLGHGLKNQLGADYRASDGGTSTPVDLPLLAKSQPNLMRVKTANQRMNLNGGDYFQRRKRRG